MHKSTFVLLCICTFVGAGAAACDNGPSRPSTVNAVRGQYLVTAVLACGDCHTTPQANGLPSFDLSDFLAGGREFDEMGQKFYSRNLTSDVETGIGGWTDDQVKRAISRGLDDQGDALFPIMPYWAFGNLSDGDLTSIVLFLRTLPPKRNQVPENTFSVSTPAPVLEPARIPDTTLAPTDAKYPSARAGRYLAGLAGACIVCHTPLGGTPDKPIDLSRAFAGGQQFPLGALTTVSANLTPDLTGLAGWTVDDIVASVRFNKEKGVGRDLCPPMPGGANRDGDMTETDLTDIATYLTTLAPIAHGPFGCTDGGVPYGLDAGN
jgi:mono/diheme cytochrome c family protein